MSIAAKLIGETFSRTLYESPIGKVRVEIEILVDGSISTTMWLIYPDGMGEEITSVKEAEEKLEL